MKNTTATGAEAETAACLFLQQQNIKIIERNYRCKLGEIDIIALDEQTLVFVEVRQRSHTAFGNGFISVDKRKQQKLIRAAKAFLCERQLFEKYPCRFDIVSATSPQHLNWLKDAFQT